MYKAPLFLNQACTLALSIYIQFPYMYRYIYYIHTHKINKNSPSKLINNKGTVLLYFSKLRTADYGSCLVQKTLNFWSRIVEETRTLPRSITVKRKPQAQMASLVLKPRIPNLDLIPDLIAASTSPRNTRFINQSGIFWSTPMR